MARNRIWIEAPVERVFDVLADPYAYPRWVVGTRDVVSADANWPEVGARFDYETGRPPLRYSGTTRVVQADPPRRLLLKTRLPIGAVDIEIELREEGGRTRVDLAEKVLASPLRRPLDATLHVRNWHSLARLKAVVEEEAVGLDLGSLHSGVHWLDEAPFSEVIARAERGHVVVAAKNGPHVTPTAISSAYGRLWIVVPRGSVKARAIAREPRVGVTIGDDERSVVVWGRAKVIDPLAVWMPHDLVERLYAGPALARYVASNQRRLGGFVLAPSSLVELNPFNRVLVAIAPERIALVEGPDVVEERGAVPLDNDDVRSRGNVADASGEPLDLDEVPDRVSDLAEGSRVRAVLGWRGVTGPVALPARWHGDRHLASVPAVLLSDDRGRAGLCLDDDEPGEIDEQRGMLVRGTARVVGIQRGYAAVSIAGDRTTVWEGTDTGTAATGGTAPLQG